VWYSAIGGIVTLILSLLTAPLAAEAQVREKTPRVGMLEPGLQQRPFPCLLALQHQHGVRKQAQPHASPSHPATSATSAGG
jgi:hypothetical protein